MEILIVLVLIFLLLLGFGYALNDDLERIEKISPEYRKHLKRKWKI